MVAMRVCLTGPCVGPRRFVGSRAERADNFNVLHGHATYVRYEVSQYIRSRTFGIQSRPLGLNLSKGKLQLWTIGADASAGGSGWMDLPESQPLPEDPIQIFPRLKERDPYKLLGIDSDASFEEIQDARNYLYEQYKQHEPSRESIELAFDTILTGKMKVRHKYGFQPPKTGKRSDAQGELKVSIWQRIKDAFEPNVSSVTMVNDGSIFLALALWAAWQAASSDPTLPLGAAVCFCAWKLYDKRNKRNPDGPYWGNSPIWGALFNTILALAFGGIVSYLLAQFVPLPPKISIDAMGLFVITMTLGFACIFLK